MSGHPFTPALAAEYKTWLDTYKETRQNAVAARARIILPLIPHYKAVAAQTGVPAVWIAAVMERESSSHLNTYLGNGDSLLHVTYDVPRGRGPFRHADGSPDWDAGAIDALHFDGMDRVASLPGGWFPERALYEWEAWNGFGYRNHGVRTPYIVGATTLQQPGRYAGDGNWTLQWDGQYGTLPIAIELIRLDHSLDLTPSLFDFDATSGDEAKLPPTEPTPAVFAPGSMLWVQHQLNQQLQLGVPLVEDGIYGRQTKRATMEFQRAHPPLDVDGIPGDETIAALKAAGGAT